MPTAVFKLAAADLMAKINPTSLNGYVTLGGGISQVPASHFDSLLRALESHVISHLPEKYRAACRRVEGLILKRFAAGGETAVTLPMTPVSDVQLFRNYPARFGKGMSNFYYASAFEGSAVVGGYAERAGVLSTPGNSRPYSDRTARDALRAVVDYTLDPTTGVITLLKPLQYGDHLIADFSHDGMAACEELKFLILNMAAAEALRGLPTLSENIQDRVGGWETNAFVYIKRLWSEDGQKTGIDFFDRLDQVDQYEMRMTGGTRAMALGAGLL